MRLINFKLDLKLKRTKYCVFPAAGNDNVNDNNSTNITIKDTNLYVSIICYNFISQSKLSKLFSKGFERSVLWNEYKPKSENKNATNEFRLFILVYTSQDFSAKRFNARKYCSPKGIFKSYNIAINRKNFHD